MSPRNATAASPSTAAARIEQVLSKGPVSVHEICLAVYGQDGKRERNAVHQRIYRFASEGRIRKHDALYELIAVPTEAPP